MNRKRVRLAPLVAIVILIGLAAVIGAAAASSLGARLYAKAGPVTMHANISLSAVQPGTSTVAPRVSCSAAGQPTPPPRTMAPSRFNATCTTASGQKVTVPLASTTGTVNFRLAAKPTFPLHAATVQIRHGGTVLLTLTTPATAPATLGPMSGSASLSGAHVAGLLNGHDTLYVQAGHHVYQGKIVRVS